LYQAENANAMQTKEAVAMQVVNYVLVWAQKNGWTSRKSKRGTNMLSILPH
jgi:hypothetical protein